MGILESIIEFERKNHAEGFGYRDKDAAIAKLREECQELISAVELESKEQQEEELGDLLYMIATFCRLYGLDPQAAADSIVAKLQGRIKEMRSLSPVPIGELSDAEQTELLRQIKQSRNSVTP